METKTFEGDLSVLIQQALAEAGFSADLGAGVSVSLEAPRWKDHGDLATSLALSLASRLKEPPLKVAETLAQSIRKSLAASGLSTSIERVEVKPPGFINFFLSPAYLYGILSRVLREGSQYGRLPIGKSKKVLIEFVSANPTGPLSVAHGRQAAVGDALANLLTFAGYQVKREYYVNDEGTQIDLLGESILARAREKAGLPFEFPANGYQGLYVADTAGKWLKAQGGKVLDSPGAMEKARRFGVQELTHAIRDELKEFGVRFHRWYPQSALARFGYLKRSLEFLKRKGHLYASEGAWWLKSTAFGDDKDRVAIRSDGRLTYIASDIAYHRRKFAQGFDLLINLWGPDHHGYISRLKAAVAALGFDPENLQIRIVQLCTLKRAGEAIPMSTREGQFITLSQVLQEVGKDASRFFFLLRKTDAHLDFDLELAKKQTPENPVYYIQYAHARISSILKYEKGGHRGAGRTPVSDTAAQNLKGAGLKPSGRSSQSRYERLKEPEELLLLRRLRAFPGVIEACVRNLEPFGLVSYLEELAEGFHRFYDRHRVVGEDPVLTACRLDLVKSVKTVLSTGLNLLGVSAPEKM